MSGEDAHPLMGWQYFCKHCLKWCHRTGGLCHVEMSYNGCASYDFNLLCTLGSWHLFRLTASIRSDCVCSPSFLLVLLLLSSLKGLSRAFRRSPIMTLPKQDYLGVAEALLRICRFTTWDTRVKKKSVFIQSGFTTCSLGSWTNYRSWVTELPYASGASDLHVCPERVKVNSTQVSGWKCKNSFSCCFQFTFPPPTHPSAKLFFGWGGVGGS